MADNTLHELKVAIRVMLSGYKKDMEAVKGETKKAKSVIDGEMSKIKSSMGKVGADKARKEVEKLTSALGKQKQQIAHQENVIASLKAKYDSMMSGFTEDKSVSGIEKMLKKAETEMASNEAQFNELLARYESLKNLPATPQITEELKKLEQQMEALADPFNEIEDRVSKLRDRLEEVKINPAASADALAMSARIEEETRKLESMKQAASDTGAKLKEILNSRGSPGTSKKLSEILGKIKELAKTAKTSSAQTESGFAKVEKAVDKVRSRILTLAKTALVWGVIQSGITEFRKYLGDCLKSNTEFSNSLNVIKTNFQVAFGAVYSAALPALNELLKGISTVSAAIAVLISNLFGKTYEASLKTAKGLKTATDAVKGYGAAASGQTFSFDETHNISDSDSSGSGSDAGAFADTTDSLNASAGLVAKIKEALKTFFAPFKESWDSNGQGVTEAAHTALSNILKLCSSVGKSFQEVWTGGAGLSTADKLLGILTAVLLTVGFIASGFDTAWNTGGAGTAIIQSLFDILGNVLGAIQKISEATAQWSAGLDFVPMVSGFQKLLAALEPLTGTICDGLVWFYENVLLPFGSWEIQDAIPAFFDMLSGAVEGINSVLQAFEPLGIWLWDNFLQPIAEWTGDSFIAGLEIVTDTLNKISNGIAKFRETGGIDNIIASLESTKEWFVDIFTRIHDGYEEYLKPVLEKLGERFQEVMDGPAGKALEKIRELADKLSEAFRLLWDNVLDPLFKWIADNIMPVLAPIVDFLGNTVISSIATVVEVIGGIVDVLSGILDFIIGVFTNDWKRAWEGIKGVFTGIWNVIKSFSMNICLAIKNGISTMLTAISTVWNNTWSNLKNTVTTVFSSIWDFIKGIINSILGGIEGMANGVVSGINRVIDALNNLHIEIPEWVPGLGGKSFGFNIPSLSPITLPRLARGGIVDGATPLIAGEAGKEAIVPLENNTGWIDQISSRIAEFIDSRLTERDGNGDIEELALTIPITLELDGDVLLKKIIKTYKRRGYSIVVEGV